MARGVVIGARQSERHRFNRFAGNREQQPMQILLGPFPLFAALQQRAVDRMIGMQFVDNRRSPMG